MKNILLPTDFSSNAWNAITYAIELYKDEPCTFYLLNTYTPAISNSRFMASTLLDEALVIEDYSKEGLKVVLSKILNKYSNPLHTYKMVSSFSLLTDQVKEMVDEFDIDVVILGTKGASGVSEVFMGSNAVKVIKAVKNCPVLAIPEYFEFETPTEIAFATDFNRFYSQSELEPIVSLAKTFNSVIRIVHVQHEIKALTELQQFNLNMLRKYFKEVEHFVHTVSEVNSVSKTLEVFSDELDIHLLAMLNYQHSYMEKLTRESVVKQLAFHSQIPLLVIPELGMNNPSKHKQEHAKKNLSLT
ncbi:MULTISPECIES: universal stress protein [Cellulophaga]|jgi:nucleotide-binding universal stress UspA family protein|uniref:Universal stress protein UspA n=1 Tax=Cellulophaga baltica 18 TaxID=1348584 RepID=A0AAU8RM53_9FLAO|nr:MULTISPECIES: universal stress protein [Cellulophaga]AIZ41371.1 universal stress protein UspA [Cellulophaga baltica 18]KGK31999.1 universal stress protein UspA [Cellulophaga sp. E6(2014)]MCR1023571.1 universal stress protein [Cellulophaga baltica]